MFHAGTLFYPIITTFAWRPFSGTGGNVQISACSLITWSLLRWTCKAKKIRGLLHRRFYNNGPVLPYFNSTSPSLGPILIMPQPSGPLPCISKDKIELQNVHKFACSRTMGQQLPRSHGTCWPSNTWMPKAVNWTQSSVQDYQQTVLLWWRNIHHAPRNLVLNCPFTRTNSYFYLLVPQTIFHWNKLDSSIYCLCFFSSCLK